MWILLVVMYICAGVFVPTLFDPVNFQNVIVQGTVIGILSLGMTFVMLIGEIDLSIVYIMGFSPLAGLLSMRILGFPFIAAPLLTLLVGAGIGLYNGLMIEKVGIPSLVQTLSTCGFYQGLYW